MPGQPLTSRKKIYWSLAGLTALGIFTTLLLDRPIQLLLVSPKVQFWLFLTGFIGVIFTMVLYGLRWRPAQIEIFIWIAMLAALVFFLFRLGASERSHMLEYSLLAIFILQALKERRREESKLRSLSYAFFITLAVGVTDELIQLFLPYRVFDLEDILFNSLAALLALGSAWFLSWLAGKYRGRKENDQRD